MRLLIIMPLTMFLLSLRVLYIEEVNNLLCALLFPRKGCPQLIVYTGSLSKAWSKREKKKKEERTDSIVYKQSAISD